VFVAGPGPRFGARSRAPGRRESTRTSGWPPTWWPSPLGTAAPSFGNVVASLS